MASNLVVTPHPVTLEEQEHKAGELLPGQSLYAFLAHNAPQALVGAWAVSIAGRQVPVEMWHKTFPKDGNLIEVRSAVGNKSTWAIIAMLVLTYFTFGIGAYGGAIAAGAGGTAAAAAVYVAGAIVINKVLGPKPIKAGSTDTGGVYGLAGSRNQPRPYAPLPLLFGTLRITPDLASTPYTYFEGDDQYLAITLTPGINIDRVEEIYNGDNPLSNFPDVSVWYAGMPGMQQDSIPLFSNVDSQAGGSLQDEDKKLTPQTRTTSPNTIRIQVDIEYTLFDKTSKGKDKPNTEGVEVMYRPAGGGSYQSLGTKTVTNRDMRTHRFSISGDVPQGQYEVTVRRLGLAEVAGKGAVVNFTFSSMASVQADPATYKGISRVALRMRATGQLSGTPDELRMVAYARPVQMWTGSQWTLGNTRASGLSNPGAQMLAYIRGYYDEDGKLVGGMGLSDMFIDIAAFQAFMLHCSDNGYTYDYYLKDARNHDEVLSSLAMAGFGQYTNSSGRISVAWAGSSQPVSAVVNMATIKDAQFQVDYTLSNTADGIELSYFDREIWDTTTLRVAAPGVTTILNPAQITAEGVTDAARAAELARYHLGQSLYQYKDISFATDLEHLSYRRMSVLSLSHDLTQWGFSGSILSATTLGGVVTLQLDTEVPPPTSSNAYIGLRIPGEMTYRVFQVRPFSSPSTVIRLVGAWPVDAAFPGVGAKNPPWDTKYCYDFKQSPGYTVRVVSVEPDNDLAGAQVSVVPESEEFWTYVKTGVYVPAPGGSSLSTRPVASNLQISEGQVVQGDTVFTELTATFDVTGPYDHADILMSNESGEMLRLTTTNTRTATWRIPAAGVYTITVRPFSPEGITGVAVSLIYATVGADAPPVRPDFFDVQQVSGGLRRYVWGFAADTIRSADYAGVEIRYVAGTVTSPVWQDMLPVGAEGDQTQAGYHAAPFESSVPVSGTWTFALRSVNTSGVLSASTLVITRTLGKNLGELHDEIRNDLSKAIVESFQRDEAEAQARVEAINYVIGQLGGEVEARNAALQEVTDSLNQSIADQTAALLNERTERVAGLTEANQLRQSADESLSFQISQLVAGTGAQFDSYRIWHFNTGTEGWNGAASEGYLNPGAVFATSPDGLAVPGDAYRYFKTRVRRTGAPVWDAQLQWRVAAGEWQSAPLQEPAWDVNGVATLDLEEIPWGGLTVDQVRVRLSQAVTALDYYGYDWIAIGRPSPGASVALVEELRQAMVTADATEAQTRNTLAVQLRGEYEGNDLDGLTTGLVWQERTARVTDTSAISTRIDGLQVELDDKASATALETLTVKVEDIEGVVSATAESVFSLEAQLDGEYAGETDWSAGETDVYAGAKTVYTVIADEDLALSRRLDVVQADFGDFSGTVTQQLQTLSTEQDAQAQLYQAVSAELATKASSQSVNLLSATVTQNSAGITALSENIDQVEAELSGKASAGAVSALQTQVSDIDGRTTANSTSITQVQASVADKASASAVFELSATVTGQGTTINSINSQAFLALNSNGVIGGFKIGNNGTVVDFTVLADKFQIVAPAGGQRLEYSQGNLRTYDNNNTLRVRLGSWA